MRALPLVCALLLSAMLGATLAKPDSQDWKVAMLSLLMGINAAIYTSHGAKR